MHLAISMFLLVATGSAAPPPPFDMSERISVTARRGPWARMAQRERVWVRAVSVPVLG